jgi:uncharacterized protein (DUF983 family)
MTNSVMTGLKRGLMMRCPACGKGKLFRSYLKVDPVCDACGHDNGQYRADDGPAYFTMLIIGHVVIAPLLFFEVIWQANPLIVLGLMLPFLALVTLGALPVVKGGVVGALWALRLKGDHR